MGCRVYDTDAYREEKRDQMYLYRNVDKFNCYDRILKGLIILQKKILKLLRNPSSTSFKSASNSLTFFDSEKYSRSSSDYRPRYQKLKSLNKGELEILEDKIEFIIDHAQYLNPTDTIIFNSLVISTIKVYLHTFETNPEVILLDL